MIPEPRLSEEYARRERRRTIGLGIAAIVGGLIITPEAVDAIRTGNTVHVLNGPGLDGYTALAAIVCLVVFGLLLIVRNRTP